MRSVREHWAATVVTMLGIAAASVLAGAIVGNDAPGARANAALRAYPVCPSRDRQPFLSTTVGAATALVPPEARTVLLCRYSGLGHTPSGAKSLALIAQHLLDASTTTNDLATKLNSLPIPTGTFHCPADGGAVIIAFFRYGSAAKADDPVTVRLGGCSTVTNGELTRVAGTTAAGRTLLRALTFQTRPAAHEVRPYELLTHCGIEWARIRGTFWKADHPLSDGQGNPPAGWANPYQAGTLSFTSLRTAVFTAPAGSVTFHRTTRTRAPVICS
jgi:hypothetical protein